MTSGLQKALLVFGILILLIAFFNLPKAKFGAESAIFFITDPAIRAFRLSGNLFDFSVENDLNKTFTNLDGKDGIYADVIMVPPAVSFGYIIIAAGSKDNLISGMKAVLDGGIFIGFVEEAFKDYSWVGLLSSFGALEQVRIAGIGQVSAQGMGGMI